MVDGLRLESEKGGVRGEGDLGLQNLFLRNEEICVNESVKSLGTRDDLDGCFKEDSSGKAEKSRCESK